jgi:acyl-CoA thioester hydrolase
MALEDTEQAARIFETRIRVRYAETDQMGVVYHANYLVWFEVGRVELLRELGFDYARMESELDTGVVVVEARVRYKAPARYDDVIVVKTRVAHLRGSLLQFAYELMREQDGTLLAEGETTHMITNRKLEKKPLPPECVAALTQAAGRRG